MQENHDPSPVAKREKSEQGGTEEVIRKDKPRYILEKHPLQVDQYVERINPELVATERPNRDHNTLYMDQTLVLTEDHVRYGYISHIDKEAPIESHNIDHEVAKKNEDKLTPDTIVLTKPTNGYQVGSFVLLNHNEEEGLLDLLKNKKIHSIKNRIEKLYNLINNHETQILKQTNYQKQYNNIRYINRIQLLKLYLKCNIELLDVNLYSDIDENNQKIINDIIELHDISSVDSVEKLNQYIIDVNGFLEEKRITNGLVKDIVSKIESLNKQINDILQELSKYESENDLIKLVKSSDRNALLNYFKDDFIYHVSLYNRIKCQSDSIVIKLTQPNTSCAYYLKIYQPREKYKKTYIAAQDYIQEYHAIKLMGLLGLSVPTEIAYGDNYIITSEIKNIQVDLDNYIKKTKSDYAHDSLARHFVLLWILGIADVIYKRRDSEGIRRHNVFYVTTGSKKGLKNLGYDPLYLPDSDIDISVYKSGDIKALREVLNENLGNIAANEKNINKKNDFINRYLPDTESMIEASNEEVENFIFLGLRKAKAYFDLNKEEIYRVAETLKCTNRIKVLESYFKSEEFTERNKKNPYIIDPDFEKNDKYHDRRPLKDSLLEKIFRDKILYGYYCQSQSLDNLRLKKSIQQEEEKGEAEAPTPLAALSTIKKDSVIDKRVPQADQNVPQVDQKDVKAIYSNDDLCISEEFTGSRSETESGGGGVVTGSMSAAVSLSGSREEPSVDPFYLDDMDSVADTMKKQYNLIIEQEQKIKTQYSEEIFNNIKYINRLALIKLYGRCGGRMNVDEYIGLTKEGKEVLNNIKLQNIHDTRSEEKFMSRTKYIVSSLKTAALSNTKDITSHIDSLNQYIVNEACLRGNDKETLARRTKSEDFIQIMRYFNNFIYYISINSRSACYSDSIVIKLTQNDNIDNAYYFKIYVEQKRNADKKPPEGHIEKTCFEEYHATKLMGLLGLSVPTEIAYGDNYIITSEIKNIQLFKATDLFAPSPPELTDDSFIRQFLVLLILGIHDVIGKFKSWNPDTGLMEYANCFWHRNTFRAATGSKKGYKNIGFDPLFLPDKDIITDTRSIENQKKALKEIIGVIGRVIRVENKEEFISKYLPITKGEEEKPSNKEVENFIFLGLRKAKAYFDLNKEEIYRVAETLKCTNRIKVLESYFKSEEFTERNKKNPYIIDPDFEKNNKYHDRRPLKGSVLEEISQSDPDHEILKGYYCQAQSLRNLRSKESIQQEEEKGEAKAPTPLAALSTITTKVKKHKSKVVLKNHIDCMLLDRYSFITAMERGIKDNYSQEIFENIQYINRIHLLESYLKYKAESLYIHLYQDLNQEGKKILDDDKLQNIFSVDSVEKFQLRILDIVSLLKEANVGKLVPSIEQDIDRLDAKIDNIIPESRSEREYGDRLLDPILSYFENFIYDSCLHNRPCCSSDSIIIKLTQNDNIDNAYYFKTYQPRDFIHSNIFQQDYLEEYHATKLMGLLGLSVPTEIAYGDNYIITSEIKNIQFSSNADDKIEKKVQTNIKKGKEPERTHDSFARHFVLLWIFCINDVIYDYKGKGIVYHNVFQTKTGSKKGFKNLGYDPLYLHDSDIDISVYKSGNIEALRKVLNENLGNIAANEKNINKKNDFINRYLPITKGEEKNPSNKEVENFIFLGLRKAKAYFDLNKEEIYRVAKELKCSDRIKVLESYFKSEEFTKRNEKNPYIIDPDFEKNDKYHDRRPLKDSLLEKIFRDKILYGYYCQSQSLDNFRNLRQSKQEEVQADKQTSLATLSGIKNDRVK